ncbi:ubiquitin carboxyl-terminal hydrolase 34-like, partial [Acanthaster planci]|uniref:Ubiquitin carboxyl-terminal hydrolase 34-like n=1 Tax=Acanthaster planci TaxID=133434 RepID=A0A8B7ZQL5_ACAPL
AFRVLLENDDDRLGVITYHGLSRLADAFNTLHMMYHEATACHVTGDLVELLSITLLTLQCASKYKERKDVKQSLLQWQERMEFAQKLLTLLNCYTPDNVRKESLALLNELVVLYPRECVQRLVPIILHVHLQFQKNNIPLATGPYFPRRMPKPAPNKTSMRPPRPELQMFLHPSQLETSHGSDPVYDAALRDYFLPYHQLVETLCHTALSINLFTEDTINLSVLVALEGVPLQLDWFAKLWKIIYHSEGSDKTGVQLLCNHHTFHDYVEGILLDERTSFNNPTINSFFCIFFPKVYKHILCNNWESVVESFICGILGDTDDLDHLKPEELERTAYKANGDVRTLLLMFSVVPPRAINPHFLPALQCILTTCRKDRELRMTEASGGQSLDVADKDTEKRSNIDGCHQQDSEAVPKKKRKISQDVRENTESSSSPPPPPPPPAPVSKKDHGNVEPKAPSPDICGNKQEIRTEADYHPSMPEDTASDTTAENTLQSSDNEDKCGEDLTGPSGANTETSHSLMLLEVKAPSCEVFSDDTCSSTVRNLSEFIGPVRRSSSLSSSPKQQHFVDVLARSIEQLIKCLEQTI